MTHLRFYLTLLLALCLAVACGKADTNKPDETREQATHATELQEVKDQPDQSESADAPETVEEAMENVQEFTDKVKEESEKQQGGPITVADRDTLVSCLPELDDWQQSKPSYSKDSVAGMTSAKIHAVYTRNDENATVTIHDSGTMSSLLQPLKMVLSMNIGHEDDVKVEEMFQWQGCQGVKEYKKDGTSAKVTVLYEDRYILEIQGNTTIDACLELLNALKLENL